MKSAELHIDRATGAALERLSAREKECLRRFLKRQTAKEMALELGISHHAVEKRLKQARTKLGAATSLDAARLLGTLEGYDQTASGSPDLASAPSTAQTWFTRPRIMGAMVMSILATVLLALAAQSGSVADGNDRSVPKPGSWPEYVSASASPKQVEDYVRTSFAKFDRDGSGYIEPAEGPSRVAIACCGSRDDDLTGEAAWQRFLSDNGDDGDNRISYAEYHAVRYDKLLEEGIPVRRADATVLGERSSPYAETPAGSEPVRHYTEEFQTVKASPERVRAFVREMFDGWDKDGSGFVELREAPDRLVTQLAKMGEDGKATIDLNKPAEELQGDTARRRYIKNVDQDGDGRVSFEEFAKPVMPQYLERGIPLIPADWKRADPPADRGSQERGRAADRLTD